MVICMLEYMLQIVFHFIFYCDSVIVFICTIFNRAVKVQEFQAYAPNYHPRPNLYIKLTHSVDSDLSLEAAKTIITLVGLLSNFSK